MEIRYKKVGKRYVEVEQKLSLNQELVLGCAVRYGLGRMTYVVGAICEELIRLESILPENFKYRVAKEIQEYQNTNGKAGMEMDNDEWNYVKWLFDLSRRYIVEANYYQTDRWEDVECILGEDGFYYGLDGGKGTLLKTRNERRKFPEKESPCPPKKTDDNYCKECNMIFYNCLCSHED